MNEFFSIHKQSSFYLGSFVLVGHCNECKYFCVTIDYIRQLQAKVPQEHVKAQQALKAGNRSEAQLCLTRRKLMENEVCF